MATTCLTKMKNDTLILALGSNLGDRENFIERAESLLSGYFGPVSVRSGIIETEAVGFDGPPFLNCILAFDGVRREPLEILSLCKETERRLGRTDSPEYDAGGRRIYRSRCIDIDIIYYGDRLVDTPELTIPHPGIRSREYLRELLGRLSREINY